MPEALPVQVEGGEEGSAATVSVMLVLWPMSSCDSAHAFTFSSDSFITAAVTNPP